MRTFLRVLIAIPLAAASVLASSTIDARAARPEVAPEKQCLWQLIEGSDPEIDCLHPAWLTDEERADVERLTRGYFKDASCVVSVKIARREVEAALAASDLVFTSPPQPVTCDISTSRGDFNITATFAPRVVFKGGVAVEATPGLANVAGVNSYLAWPVVHYINFAERITKTMLLMINAYRNYKAPRKT